MYKVLFAMMLAALCFGCVPSAEDEARDRCVLGILNDSQLKEASNRLGGATFRYKLCTAAVASEGVGGSYRQFVTQSMQVLLLRRAVQRASW